MSVPMVPHRFVDASVLDPEKVNDNLEAIADDVNRNLSKRYTYSCLIWDFSGVTNASAEALRQFAIRRGVTDDAAEVIGVEVVIYTATAVTWTLACSDTTWPSLELLTTASSTTESRASQFLPAPVSSASSDVTFTLSASGASTVTNGYLVVHLRCDRGNQGSSHAGYTPTLVDAVSSTAGSVLDTQLQAAETAVSTDTNNNKDLRCECFVVRTLASGSAATWPLPSGARRIRAARLYVVAAATETLTASFVGTGLTVSNIAVVGGGVAARSTGGSTFSGSLADDPTNSAADFLITLTASGGGTVLLGFCLVWWS